MIWKLENETPAGKRKKAKRLYRNTLTDSTCETEEIYTDKDGRKWWGFVDLYRIPYIRVSMATHLSQLFTIGLSLSDILAWCKEEKELINGSDPEKYQKLYALILEKEKIAAQTADPIRQHLSLCSVYVLRDDEEPGMFTETMAQEKILYWNGDMDMIAFFLSWHHKHMGDYTKNLNRISGIVSRMKEELQGENVES